MIYRFVTRGSVEERITEVAKRKMLTPEQVTCRVSKAHEQWWICCSIMLCVSLYCSSVHGVGAPPNRGMLNTWPSTTQMVSLHANYCSSLFYFTTFIYSFVQWKTMNSLGPHNTMERITWLKYIYIPLLFSCTHKYEWTEFWLLYLHPVHLPPCAVEGFHCINLSTQDFIFVPGTHGLGVRKLWCETSQKMRYWPPHTHVCAHTHLYSDPMPMWAIFLAPSLTT